MAMSLTGQSLAHLPQPMQAPVARKARSFMTVSYTHLDVYKRQSFAQAVDSSGSHWLDRPIVPNGLDRPLEELFLPAGARLQR